MFDVVTAQSWISRENHLPCSLQGRTAPIVDGMEMGMENRESMRGWIKVGGAAAIYAALHLTAAHYCNPPERG